MTFNKDTALKELDLLNKQAAEAAKLLAEANGKKKIHEEEIAAREKELRDMGVDPEHIDETLDKLIQEYNEKLEKAKEMIPVDILEKARRV